MNRALGVVIILLVAVLVAGCSVAGGSSHRAVPTPASADSSVIHQSPPIPDGTVATAVLTSSTGAALGTATFIKSGAEWDLHLPSLDLGDPASVLPTLADSPIRPGACGSDNVWEVGIVNQAGLPMRVDVASFGGDPSFFTMLVLVRYGGAVQPTPDSNGCIQPILATGPIVWSIPVQRPWVHPLDSGVRIGARGAVELRNGAPALYTTAPDDSWNAIAARFGLSASDLAWLNPNRLGGDAAGEAYAQQVLNLDPAGRGNSESRRPH